MLNNYLHGPWLYKKDLVATLICFRQGQDGKSGLEVVLVIIDRLLKPELPDQSALEVGGLAAELVDKVRINSFLMQLYD